jgi:membrane-bound lytic murein transglycosylase D
VDIAGNITTAANPNVTAKAEAELKTTRSDLPLVMNQYVSNYINFFSNNPRGHATIVNSLERMGRYKAMIENVLKQNGVPQDLIYQAVAESGFRPWVVNRRSGAAGMWQFMPWGTYGLVHNAWVDQRFDPVESTEAYAREIKKMYNQLGDWYLAMAAYDWGPGNVQRAVERTGYADFWQLYKRNNLPQETKNYVPIILAVTIMAKNPTQYGLTDLTPDPPLQMDTVKTDYGVSLRLVADIVGAPVSEIQTLNPSLLRMCTPPDDPYELHLPKGTASTYEQDIAQIPKDKRLYWRLDSVTDGTTLAEVARKWHVSLSELALVNQLQTTSDLSGVDKLIIPLPPRGEPRTLRGGLYHVRRGDTLITIADRFGVTVEQLRAWNHLRTNFLRAGHSLYVAAPARIRAFHRRSSRYAGSARRPLRAHGGLYRVRPGDTLGGIASRFHVSVTELRRWNHLHGNEIRAGHTLRVSR